MKDAIRKFTESVQLRSRLLTRVRSHRYFKPTLLVALVVLAACVHIWQRVKVLDLVQQVSALNRENADLVDDLRKVRADAAGLSMASRVEKYAIDSLGMIPVPPERAYTLVPRNGPEAEVDDIRMVVSALKRVARHLPTISETRANAGELPPTVVDSLSREGEAK